MLKILHTSDIQLGANFKWLENSQAGETVREENRAVLGRIVRVAKDERCDLVIIAGDLFNSNRVSANLVAAALNALRSLDDIPVYILPGTHDCLEKASVYNRREFTEAGNIKVIKGDGTISFEIPELNLTLYARPNLTKTSSVSPLKGLVRKTRTKYHVAVAHGSIQIKGKSSPDDFPITLNEIETSRMDYIALGHWHSFYDYSQGQTRAFYSGSPETQKFGEQDSGYVAIVELRPSTTEVRDKKVGRLSWEVQSINVADFRSPKALKENLISAASKTKLLRVEIKGLASPKLRADIERISDELSGHFLYIDIDTRSIKVRDEDISVGSYPELSVVGQFLRAAKQKWLKSAQSEKALYEEVIQLGSALLEGEEV